jgi:agmatine deiminase
MCCCRQRPICRTGRLQVVPLPMPRPKFQDGQRLPASYCNFYLANGICVVPQFDDPADAEAVAILQSLLPERRVIGLPALDLVFGLGAFHCLSQQQPRLD